MKIRKLSVRNFLSFGSAQQEFQFDSLNTIVGPNNSGKTNVLRALSLPLQPIEQGGFDPQPYCYGGDLDNRFYLKISLEFNDEEFRALADFITCSLLTENLGLTAGGDAESFKSYVQTHALSLTRDIFSRTSIIVEGGSSWETSGYVAFGIEWNGKLLFINQQGNIMKEPTVAQGYSSLGLGRQLLDVMRTDPSKSAGDNLFPILSKKIDVPEIIAIALNSFRVENILSNWGRMPEIGRLQAFTYKRGYKDQYYNIFQLILLIYRSSIVRTSDVRNKPRAYLSFEEDLELHDTDFNSLTGEEIPFILFKLKNSPLPQRRERYRDLIKAFEKISNGSEFDIIVRPKRIKIGKHEELARFPPSSMGMQSTVGFGSATGPDFIGVRGKEDEISTNELSVHIIKGGLSIPLELAAAGLIESLLLLIALIDQRDKTILLDEPALNLHPNLQLRFAEIFEKSIATDRNQIIMVTHSPYLINPQHLSQIWRMSRKNDESISTNLGTVLGMGSKTNEEKIRLLLTKTTTKGILFSRGVILTEGPSDRIIIEKLDRGISAQENKPTIDESEWALIDADGKLSMRKFMVLFKELGIPYAVVVDPDVALQCTETVTVDGTEIKTSRLFADLSSLERLSQEESQQLQAIQPSGNGGTYSPESLDEVRRLAKKHNSFVLSATPEDLLGVSVRKKESKPLVDSRKMEEMLSLGRVPRELLDLLSYIKELIQTTAKV